MIVLIPQQNYWSENCKSHCCTFIFYFKNGMDKISDIISCYPCSYWLYKYSQYQVSYYIYIKFYSIPKKYTLIFRWADNLQSMGSDGIVREFDHPFVQACAMFMGEMLCLIVFKIIYFVLLRRQVITHYTFLSFRPRYNMKFCHKAKNHVRNQLF